MIRSSSLTDTVTLYGVATEPSGESVFGDPEYDEQAGVEVPAFVTPLDATEIEINRDVRLNRYSVVFEPDAAVDGLTEIEWRGKRYAVQGEPRVFSSYRGEHHLEVEIRGIEG